MASERLRDAAPMPTDDDPPSALWCLFAASLPAVPFCCFLHPSALLWWFPVWVAVFYLPMPAVLVCVHQPLALACEAAYPIATAAHPWQGLALTI